jgi:hypothetical protein
MSGFRIGVARYDEDGVKHRLIFKNNVAIGKHQLR